MLTIEAIANGTSAVDPLTVESPNSGRAKRTESPAPLAAVRGWSCQTRHFACSSGSIIQVGTSVPRFTTDLIHELSLHESNRRMLSDTEDLDKCRDMRRSTQDDGPRDGHAAHEMSSQSR